MSGAGRRTIHRETGSGGWPNGLTVDYLEKRILWIDARSVPLPALEASISPAPAGPGWARVPGLGSAEGGKMAWGLSPEPGGQGLGPAEGCRERGAG